MDAISMLGDDARIITVASNAYAKDDGTVVHSTIVEGTRADGVKIRIDMAKEKPADADTPTD